MSILTQFLPTVNAQIGEIKTVLRANLYTSANTTGQPINVLTDVDGGVWLRTNKTYSRADYPQLANTIGIHGGVNFYDYGNITGGNPWENRAIYQFHYSQGGREWRCVTGYGQVFGNTASGHIPNLRAQADTNPLYDIMHNSEGTGLPGNNWAVVGYNGIYVNDLSYVYDTGFLYGSTDPSWRVQGISVAYGNNTYVVRGSFGQSYHSTNQGGSYTLYRQQNNLEYLDPNFKLMRGLREPGDGSAGYSAAAIRYGSNNFSVLASAIGLVSFSANGTGWPGVPGTYEYWGQLNSAKCANNIWVTCGVGSSDSTSANLILATSSDGFYWTRRAVPAGFYDEMNRITFGSNTWIVGSTSGRMIYSTNNGVNWANVNVSTGAAIQEMDFAANVNNSQMFCYVGSSGIMGITTNANSEFVNGNSWVSTTQNSGSQIIWTVKYVPGPNIWITGNNTGDITTSTDGRTWIPRGRIAPEQAINRMVLGNNDTKIVVATSGGYVYSADAADANVGITAWTGFPGFSNTGTHVAYSGNLYVVTGNSYGFFTSTDGLKWNSSAWWESKVHTSYTMRSVAYANTNSHNWIAVGDVGYIKLSQNGHSWSGQQKWSTANSMWGAAYGANATNANIYVTGGAAGNLSVSDDGIYWAGVNATTSLINAVYYANGLFFYGTNGGGLASSPDGRNWSDASNTTQDLNSATYGNNLYVIVGNGGVLRTSNNGIYWQSVNSNSVQNIWHVEYGNNLFFAVGATGNVITSTDGNVWIRQTSTTANILYAAAYGGTQSLYVYGGQSGNLATSTDGTTWTARTSGTTSEIRAITASPTLFVYATLSGGLASSTDGITWTSRTSGTTNSFYAAMFANGVYVVAGQNGNLITSTDGTTWTARTSNTASIIYSLGYNSNANLYFYGAASGGYGTSTDAITWYANTNIFTTVLGSAFGNNSNTTVLCGSGGMIRHSRNSIAYSGSANGQAIRAFAYGNGVYMHVGDGGVVRTSTDGLIWSVKTPGTANAFYAAIYANDKFLISGGSGNTRYSVDNGETWTGVNVGTANLAYTLAYGNGLFVRGGQNGNVGTSTDGITWNQSNVTTVNAFSNLIYSIAFSNVTNTFIYTGAAGRTAISTDGNNWTTIYPWANTTNFANYEVLYGNNEWMIFGDGGTPIKSVDANNWSTSKTNVELHGIAYGANVWVAVGANGNVRTSTDGVYWSIDDANANVISPINWSRKGNTANLLFIEYLNNKFLTGGDLGVFRYSTDGYNWSSANHPAQIAIRAVAYGQGKYVIVGNTGLISTSTDLSSWSDVYFNRNFTDTYPELFLEYRTKNKQNLTTVVYNPTLNIFAAGGEDRLYLTSTDGVKWNNLTENLKFPYINDRIFNLSVGDNGKMVFVGNRSQFATSTDGSRWGGCGQVANTWGSLGWLGATGLTYDANTGLYCITNGGLWSTSSDLWHWETSASRNPGWSRVQSWQTSDYIRYMASGYTTAGGNVTISVGPIYGLMLWSQVGGRLWNSTTFDDRAAPHQTLRRMAYGNNTFVAVGNGGRIIKSVDGIHWEKVNTAATITGTRTLYGVYYNMGQWLITGDYTIMTSPDLVNWTKCITSGADYPGAPGFVYTAGFTAPNISMVGHISGNTFWTYRPDPSKPITGFNWSTASGYDVDAEFYIPRINVASYQVSGNFEGTINQSNARPTSANTGNLMCEVVTYIKAK